MKIITILLLTVLFFSLSAAQAGNMGKGQFKKHMAHANPVPNYVSLYQ
ncbi:MAG: hypothetical protein KUF74_14585 [Candidatus Thiodiazotropha sp. (ex Ctena orbiculata)]|nr:hypothetical protein [Candidatus Thiodiazotropha taylori]